MRPIREDVRIVLWLGVFLFIVWLVTLFVRSADSQDGSPIEVAKNVKLAEWMGNTWLCWDVSLMENYLRMDQMIAITVRPSNSEIKMSDGSTFRINVSSGKFDEAIGIYFLDKAKQEQLP